MKISGIYRIRNLINDKCYIGSSINIKKRWTNHTIHLNKNRHVNPHLQNAWNKYGKNNFRFEIVEEVSTARLADIEQLYLDIIQPFPNFYYNIGYDSVAASRGKHHSEETKKKMRLAHTKERNHFYGKHHSKKSKLQISKSCKGLQAGELHPAYDHRIYHWHNSNTDITEDLTQHDLLTKYNLDSSNLTAVIKKRRKSHMGWKIYDNHTEN